MPLTPDFVPLDRVILPWDRMLGFCRVVGTSACFVLAAMIVARYPIMPAAFAVCLVIYAAALWLWPTLWLIVIPAILPAFDLTPWTGWSLVGESDPFILVTIGVLLIRAPPRRPDFILKGLAGGAIALSTLICLIGIVLGFTSLLHIPYRSDLPQLRPDNALGLGKGFLTALALLPFLRQRIRAGFNAGARFATGMIIGLALVTLATIVERALFPGLFDFKSDYRVVATFSSMHLGGGYAGAYMAMTLPFVLVCLVKPHPLRILATLGVTLAAAYAIVVTFARAAYLAAMVSTLIILIGGIFIRRGSRTGAPALTVLPFLMMAIVSAGLVTAALTPGYMSGRFTTVAGDLLVRMGNWSDGLKMRDGTASSAIFGMGLGTFPRAVLAHRQDGETPSNFAVEHENGEPFLSMTIGAPFYFGQKVPALPNQKYALSIEARSPDDEATLEVDLCEKLLLYSYNCRGIVLKPKEAGKWEVFTATLSTKGFTQRETFGMLRRPVELSLFDPSPTTRIEIKSVTLTNSAGQNIVLNGAFSNQTERWYFTDDNHLVWRMKNQYLMTLFESGILGIIGAIVLLGTALSGACRAMRRGDPIGNAIAASLAAFLCSSLFDFLLDAPRIATLFYLICFIGVVMHERYASGSPGQPSSSGIKTARSSI
jgi:hypothetical protein